MKRTKVISGLAVLAIVFTTSCSKMQPLDEKEEVVTCEGICGTEEAKGMILVDENGPNGTGITDPDHDEEHDKDDSSASKEE
jgi:hypothetical protein